MFDEGDVGGVALFCHVGEGDEAEGGGVDAVTQSAGFFRSVWEDVSEV